MSLTVVKPPHGERAYALAADIFSDMYKKVTGKSVGEDGENGIVLIGSDAVNDIAASDIFEGNISDLNIRYGTDDYCIRTYKKNGQNVLLLAGGRGRSTIYAVYDYFERFVGCHYFWDGDVIPHKPCIPMENIDLHESPRFEYRGLRYFAHRGLKRFQAEHWSLDDWKKEIDWIMKKRLNYFMLRIGMDDTWQRAFGDIVPYPEDFCNIESETGYDERSDFWTLKYRGKLREEIMSYARENDLITSTDCGTMTHWYSRTPLEFLEKQKPSFLGQADNQYNEFDTGKVFDFRKPENMEYYMRLTKTMAEEFDKNNYLFHTIGLGERRIYSDNQKNFNLKKLCYRRIMQYLREEYPNSVLMLASWDFVGWWQPHEVQNLIKELDPERTIILDYTSEGNDVMQNFTNWGIVNSFPWIFGLFHAYEPESELRGPYDRIEERLKIAKDDPFCKGMVLWPELAHSDPIVLEYLSENAWSPLKRTPEEIIEQFCENKYGAYGDRMNECWQKFFPFLKLSDWGGYTKIETETGEFKTDAVWFSHSDAWTKPIDFLVRCNNGEDMSRVSACFKEKIGAAKKEIPVLSELLRGLADITEHTSDEFIIRDSIDIARTICGRFLNYMIVSSVLISCGKINMREIRTLYEKLISHLSDLLWKTADFSLLSTLKSLKQAAEVNPRFERTLKNNILNVYCRQYCSELTDFVFKDEAEMMFEWLECPYPLSEIEEKSREKEKQFMNKPLEQMQRNPQRTLSEILFAISAAVKKAERIFE